MSELETLTKTLIQVVSSLQDLLAKKSLPQPAVQTESPRLKKTPEMTYSEFVKKALLNRQPLEVTSKKTSYRLQEDLQLLQQLSNHNQISIKTFQQISNSKRLNRTAESLRSRYHDYLYRIEQKQMKKIVNWIQKEDLIGYIVFDNNDIRIQHHDPRESQDRKRYRPVSQDTESRKHQKISKLSKIKNVDNSCKQLSEVLQLYSKMINMPVKTLTQRLDQLSGDLVLLDKYIETKDARLLWTSEEDEILKKGGPEVQLLRRYRGEEVDTRRKYLGLA